jgi:hypothetical protein
MVDDSAVGPADSHSDGAAARGLDFLLPTAARTGEFPGVKQQEIDFDGRRDRGR